MGRKTSVISTRLNHDEYLSLVEKCAEQNTSTSQFLRQILRAKIGIISTLRLDNALSNELVETNNQIRRIGTNLNQIVKLINTKKTISAENNKAIHETVEQLNKTITDLRKEIKGHIQTLRR